MLFRHKVKPRLKAWGCLGTRLGGTHFVQDYLHQCVLSRGIHAQGTNDLHIDSPTGIQYTIIYMVCCNIWALAMCETLLRCIYQDHLLVAHRCKEVSSACLSAIMSGRRVDTDTNGRPQQGHPCSLSGGVKLHKRIPVATMQSHSLLPCLASLCLSCHSGSSI